MLPAAAGTAAVADPEAGGVVVVAVDRSREAAGAADLQKKRKKSAEISWRFVWRGGERIGCMSGDVGVGVLSRWAPRQTTVQL